MTLVREFIPHVVIMDVNMPDLNGIEATRQILSEYPEMKVIALSMHADRRFVLNMLKAGAHGYLLKDCAFDELVTAIQTVNAGKSYLSPDVATVVLDIQSNDAGDGGLGVNVSSALDQRDRELIRLIAEGKSARDIAELKGQSVKTIEGRRRRVMQRLNIDSMVGLVKYAIRNRLVSVEPSPEEAAP